MRELKALFWFPEQGYPENKDLIFDQNEIQTDKIRRPTTSGSESHHQNGLEEEDPPYVESISGEELMKSSGFL